MIRKTVSVHFRITLFLSTIGLSLIAGSLPASASSLSITTLPVSGVGGGGANEAVHKPQHHSMSADGRFTVFSSIASNIIPTDTNGLFDVYLHDRVANKLELISHNLSNQPANQHSYSPSISPDGRYIAFVSRASNIAPLPSNSCEAGQVCANIFIYDRTTKKSTWVNKTATGERIPTDMYPLGNPPVISADGKSLLISAHPRPYDRDDLIVFNIDTHTAKRVNIDENGQEGTHEGFNGTMSQDGRRVVFLSYAKLVAADTNNMQDVYMRDVHSGTTGLVSVANDGKAADYDSLMPVISGDGRSAAFVSYATNIGENPGEGEIHVFLRDLQTNKTRRISARNPNPLSSFGGHFSPAISADGRHVVYVSSPRYINPATPYTRNIFMYYRDIGITRIVDRASRGGPAGNGISGSFEPSISGDARTVAFVSDATNLTPTKVRDWPPSLYITHNPVVSIPYYDPTDYLDILKNVN